MWRRALAFLIDLVPLVVLAIFENVAGVADNEAVGALNLVLLISYFAGLNYRVGGTVGKRLMGLRVGLPASPNVPFQLLVRAFVKVVCLFPPLATVYALIAIWRKDGRSLSDFFSGSIVLEANSLSPPPRPTLLGRLSASLLAIVAPWILLILLLISLFGVMVVEEAVR